MVDHLHSHFFIFTFFPAASGDKLNLHLKKEESVIDYSLGWGIFIYTKREKKA